MLLLTFLKFSLNFKNESLVFPNCSEFLKTINIPFIFSVKDVNVIGLILSKSKRGNPNKIPWNFFFFMD